MLYDDEFDQHATKKDLEKLLRGGTSERPLPRFANRMIEIESILQQLDEDTRYAQLASWAIAGIHCGTRVEIETYNFYIRHMSEGKQLDVEDLSLEMRIALTLAELRKQIISEIVPENENERIHQIAHLEKKVSSLLALVGDADAFQDQFEIIVNNVYKQLSPQDIVVHVRNDYTVDRLAEFLVTAINQNRINHKHILHAFEKSLPNSRPSIEDFYDEDVTTFTPQGAKALLYSVGYLEEDL